ncbi:MAG: hypothetical protein ACRD2L_18360 [Terriglobia bacterium]
MLIRVLKSALVLVTGWSTVSVASSSSPPLSIVIEQVRSQVDATRAMRKYFRFLEKKGYVEFVGR